MGNLVKHCNPLTLDHHESNKSSHVHILLAHQQEPNCLNKYIQDDAWIVKRSKCDESFTELLHTHTHTSYESPTSVLIRIQERRRCPAPCSNSCRSLLPSSAQYDRRVNTDAEQQTRGDHFISDDSPACCRNQTNSTGNYLAVIN